MSDDEIDAGPSPGSPAPAAERSSVSKLDSLIAEASEAAFAPKEAPKALVDDEPAMKADRPRGPDGKFTAAEPSAKEPAQVADSTPPTTTTQQPGPQVQPLEAPPRWSDGDKAKFAKWPRDAQESVLQRHREMEADYTRKTQEAAEIRKSADPLLQAVQPFQKYLQSINLPPAQAIHGLLSAEYTLRNGSPQEKAQALADIVRDYRIDLALASRTPASRVDPAIQQLHQTVRSLEQRQRDWENSQRSAVENQQVRSAISEFTSQKDQAGNPKYPYYDKVASLMRNYLASDPPELAGKSMQDMLDAAYREVTKPIEALRAEVGARQQATAKANAEAVAQAKRAAPVRSNGSAPKGTVALKGLDAILGQAIDSHMTE